MKDRTLNPWVVYLHEGKLARTLDRFPSEAKAQKRARQIRRRSPGDKIGVYFERPNPAPIPRYPLTENAEKN